MCSPDPCPGEKDPGEIRARLLITIYVIFDQNFFFLIYF